VHWWQTKPDYAFGWLTPAFVIYLVFDRWPKLQKIFLAPGESPLPRAGRRVVVTAAAVLLAVGLGIFLLGAIYRAGAGVTQPGSLALAIGFAAILPGMIYFNVPEGRIGATPPPRGWRRWHADARLRATALFLFPALIWMVSAPLCSSPELRSSSKAPNRTRALGVPCIKDAAVLYRKLSLGRALAHSSD